MAYDEETTRIFNALSKICRVCSHIKFLHLQKGCTDQILSKEGKLYLCNCKEYIPKDNIEYLEYMSEKERRLR